VQSHKISPFKKFKRIFANDNTKKAPTKIFVEVQNGVKILKIFIDIKSIGKLPIKKLRVKINADFVGMFF